MGATNPADAAEGTIRKDLRRIDRGQFGPRLGRDETAAIEIAYFFQDVEIVGG